MAACDTARKGELLRAIDRAKRARKRSAEMLDAAIRQAIEEGVPHLEIADRAGIPRSTFSRRYGQRRNAS